MSFVSCLIEPHHPDKLKIYPSTQNKSLVRANINNISFSKESTNTVYAATVEGAFVSRNKGKDWEKLDSSKTLSILAKSSNELFTVTEFALWMSDENAKNWTSRSFGLPNALNNSFWDATTICHIDSPKNTIYLCRYDGFLITNNNGGNWRWQKTPISTSTKIRTRRMTVLSDETFYLNMSTLVGYVGSSMNNVFVKITPDGKGSVIFEKEDFGIIGAVSNADSKVIYKGDSISDDGGFSWRQMNVGFNLSDTNQRTYSGSMVNLVTNVVSPVSSKVAYLYAHRKSSIYATINQGDSWKLVITPEATGAESIIRPDPKDATTVLWASKSSIYRSKDAGTNWERITLKNSDFGEIRDFAVNPQDSNNIVIASSKGLWKTLNNGKMWQLVTQGLNGDSISEVLVSGNIVIAKGNYGIYRLFDKNSEIFK